MADSIGSESFIALYGDLDLPGTQVEELERPGEHGREFRKLGARGDYCQLEGIADVDTDVQAAAKLQQYATLEGTIVEINLRGASYSDWLVVRVRVTLRKKMAAAVGGLSDGLWIVRSTWEVVYAGT